MCVIKTGTGQDEVQQVLGGIVWDVVVLNSRLMYQIVFG